MKRIFITLTAATIAFAGCKKEQLEPLTKPAEQQTGFNPKYEDIKPLILTFKEQAELSNYGTSKTSSMADKTLAEAEWTLEGALNYDHAHPVQRYADMQTDTLTITVSNAGTNSNGETMVDGDDLAQAYANLLTAINNLVPSGEDVDVVDVELINISQFYSTFAAIVSSGQPLTLSPISILPNDDWKAGEDLGKCDGTNVGTDAAGKITTLLNYNIANGYVVNFSGYTNGQIILFHTAVEQKVDGNHYGSSAYSTLFGQVNDPYKIIGTGRRFAFDCVDDVEMAGYVSNTWSIVSSLQPSGKDIIQLLVKDRPYLDIQTGNLKVDHHLHHVHYGIPLIL